MRREPGGGKTAILAEQGSKTGPAYPADGALQWAEWLVPGAAATLADIRLLASVRTPHQHIEIGESALFGRIFRLDGRIMSTEADGYIQHELMVHPMALAHGAPACALVVGGGDGASARELLRMPGMREVVVAELDAGVIALARTWLGGLHGGAFDDPRVAVEIGDALATMQRFAAQDRRFDLIVFDLTEADDGGPASALFETAGLHAARRCLAPGGALSLHLGPPWHRPRTAAQLLERLRGQFTLVQPLTAYVPAYGALWAIAIASDTVDVRGACPQTLARRLADWGMQQALRCYHPGLHQALFALPLHLRAALGEGAPRP